MQRIPLPFNWRILVEVLVVSSVIALMVLGMATYRSMTAIEERLEKTQKSDTPEPARISEEALGIAPENSEKVVAEPRNYSQIVAETADPIAVERAAQRASELTGVRKDFLLGAMTVESMLGQNVGQCTYKEVADGAEAAHERGQLGPKPWQTFLARQEQIRQIASELGYNVEELKVSCNPNPAQYVGTGGAMGIAQFMPSTWYEYKERIAKISGKVHPDPWSVDDGVLAMALKFADVPGVTEHNQAAEKRASKMYLSGSVSTKYEWYANDIQYWADNNHEILGERYIMSLLFAE